VKIIFNFYFKNLVTDWELIWDWNDDEQWKTMEISGFDQNSNGFDPGLVFFINKKKKGWEKNSIQMIN
jgi:hypothetical protein